MNDPDEGWSVAEDLGDGWVATYRYVVKDGRPVLAELRVQPGDGDSALELVSLGLDGVHFDPAGVPARGLTLRRLRTMRPSSVLAEVLADWEEDVREGVSQPAEVEILNPGWMKLKQRWAQARRRVPKRRDERLLMVAWMYVTALARGVQHPNKEIAAEIGRKPSQVRDDVTAARREGLLTPGAGKGRTGGQLTDAAFALMEEELTRG